MRLDENLELLIILIGNRAVKKAQEEIYTEEEIKELKIIFEFIKEVIVKWQD